MVAGEIARPVDVLVIGAGPGGYTAAARAKALGRDVTVVEAGVLGGTCLNVGCIPSKALITLAHDLTRVRRRIETGRGLVGRLDVDLAAARRWSDGIVTRLTGGVAALLRGVDVVAGTARFVGRDRVAIETPEHVEHLRFRHAVIATGSRPASVPFLPVDGRRIVDSTGALALTEVPARLVVVGGGYIGVELGSAYAALGSAVTIVEVAERILGEFDDDVAAVVAARLADRGVTVRTGATVVGDDGHAVGIDADGDTEQIPADVVMVAAGRRPNTDDLQLDDAGLTTDPAGRIPVDRQQRTAVPTIFAVGDVTDGPALAHKAYEEGRVAAEAMCGWPSEAVGLVPLVVFGTPEVASIGLGERAAAAAGRNVTVGKAPFAINGRALTLDEPDGFVKLVVDTANEVVVGASVVGPNASELIAELTVAVECALRLDDLLGTMHVHPTLAETVVDAARAVRRTLDRQTLVR